ncbi:MAG: hypothetical protein ABL973_10555 [Micropepsaceae bacterium]
MPLFRPVITFAVVCAAAMGLSACERSVAGACTGAQDAALKVSILADDLNSAQIAGTLGAAQVGDLGARILDAGARFGSKGNHQSYCTAIDKIRSEAFRARTL